MRKTIMMVVLTALLVALLAIPAVAVNKVCGGNPCNGTDDRDYLAEQVGRGVADVIYGQRGNDTLDANNYRNDRDRLYGGRNDDWLYTNDGDGRDTADGDSGRDRCVVDSGDRTRSCERVNRVN